LLAGGEFGCFKHTGSLGSGQYQLGLQTDWFITQ